ncbi:helix-turn-helix domain-containing protein [Pseudomonas sp. P5_109]|jgi:AraC family ethanolamine operon transcriptional activator|uniref:helix-turn-helix domain-containing protein n=1 Tax=Pseudomonas sp. P5_109 TaxID=3043441 RepID=UPI002A36C26B|nr:helix-turn-helix domain-containing protein [Pseudomonas sp. P5_109]WPN33024.1 helix-turn-helix domain-containing protein [Pseudomonas sp. P5_109]
MSIAPPDEIFHLSSASPSQLNRTIGNWEMSLIPTEHEARIRQHKLFHSPVLQCSRLEFDSSVTLVSSVPAGFVTFAISQSPIGCPVVNNHKLRPNEVIVLHSDESVHYTCEPNETLFTITTTLEHYDRCRQQHRVIDILANRTNHSFQAENFQFIQSAIQAISAACVDINDCASPQLGEAQRSAIESTVLASLLQALTPAGGINRKVPTRRKVAIQAIEYIHENTKKTLNIKSLVRQLETTTRTLHFGFIETFGMSPMAYIRNLRLASARRDLINKTWPTVTETAMFWNFHHLGRFSKAYQIAYGESPSETARRNSAKPRNTTSSIYNQMADQRSYLVNGLSSKP